MCKTSSLPRGYCWADYATTEVYLNGDKRDIECIELAYSPVWVERSEGQTDLAIFDLKHQGEIFRKAAHLIDNAVANNTYSPFYTPLGAITEAIRRDRLNA